MKDAETNIPIVHMPEPFQPVLTNVDAISNVDRIRKAVTMAYIDNNFKGENVVGVIPSNGFSSIVLLNLQEVESVQKLDECTDRIPLDVIRAVLQIAFKISIVGCEGRRVGTAFVIGDVDEALKRSHQMILNPFAGHPDKLRNITDPSNWESIREFSQLDGVFIVDPRGRIVAAGRYIDLDVKKMDLEKGLGGRHVAAAAITHDTQAIAITLSQSGGVIRIYKDGVAILKLGPYRI